MGSIGFSRFVLNLSLALLCVGAIQNFGFLGCCIWYTADRWVYVKLGFACTYPFEFGLCVFWVLGLAGLVVVLLELRALADSRILGFVILFIFRDFACCGVLLDCVGLRFVVLKLRFLRLLWVGIIRNFWCFGVFGSLHFVGLFMVGFTRIVVVCIWCV